ncbi:glutamine--fructose-6-phosphate transaminase (isomerizing) [Natronomonas salina]|uniref:glutamine--fructose-6-phosphate transaminase (isomerizing) n=1 Tax=Natronomonas salina TaxID=1710540 RepID=UPI0015B682EE|nr:glutamine--fructose-6-phosphate transaminase (isomerizing) [Natronomonas salina]QLD89417.1 glutamine--fructose-6-phosphate transaminase (isomerizing) [Natronomonas salina]
MCGIIGRIGEGRAVDELVTGLENLDYRGYDSSGIAVRNGSAPVVVKQEGKITALQERLAERSPEGNAGIGHTRWSTHGPPTDANAHPHTDCDGDVAVVHNGIIENYDELRSELQARGHEFTSETDSEVVPHLIGEALREGHDPESAFRRAVAQLEGSYAIAAVVDDDEAIFATRRGSPLVVGYGTDGYYVASDVPAFLDFTDRVSYLEDGDVAELRHGGVTVTDPEGAEVHRERERVDWNPEDARKGEYDHYMQKEINEQPTALEQTIKGRIDVEAGTVDLEDFPPGAFDDVDSVQIVACGTSYHAGMYFELLLKEAGVPASTHLASEYVAATPPIDESTLTIAVTQSGETADTLRSIRHAADCGARTLAVTNVVGSTAARECDDALFIRAGPEIGVAATKTFSSQVVTLALLAERIVEDHPDGEAREDPAAFLEALRRLPEDIERTLEDSDAHALCDYCLDSEGVFFIGRSLGYPVSLEGALKLKEITYEHAEGYAAGELKHGPLALVTEQTPVVTVLTGRNDEKTIKNASEARTRGAPVIVVASEDSAYADRGDVTLTFPGTHPDVAGLLANVQLQLLSYHTADRLGRAIDKPRNLAKSVTVE